jgi:hypothetical protein
MLTACGGGGSSSAAKTKASGGSSSNPDPEPPEPPAATLPDLRIDSPMQMTGQAAGVSLHFEIVNDGVTAMDVAWNVVRVGTSGGSNTTVASGTIAMLAQDDMEMEMVDDPAGNDEHQYIITVDPANAIVESSEDNNSVSLTAVGGSGGNPPVPEQQLDLRFDNAHYHGMYYYTDPIFHFWIQNVNADGLTARNVGYTVRVDGDVAYSGSVASIAANQEALVFIHTPNVSVGHHTFEIFIDPENDISESNKGNNYYRCEVDCRLLGGPFPASATVDVNFQDPHFHGPFPGRRLIFHWFLRNHWQSTLNDAGNPDDPTGHAGVEWQLQREGVVIDSGVITDRIGPDGLKEMHSTVIDPGDMLEAHYTLIIDPEGKIAETAFGETNNSVSFTVVLNPGTAN